MGLRAIVFGLMMLIFVFPALMAKTTGHYYLGFKRWEDILGIGSWKGIAMWVLVVAWMIYPVLISIWHEIFVRGPLLKMADKSIDDAVDKKD